MSVFWFDWDFPISLKDIQNREEFGASEPIHTLFHSFYGVRFLNRDFVKFPVLDAKSERAVIFGTRRTGELHADWAASITPAAIFCCFPIVPTLRFLVPPGTVRTGTVWFPVSDRFGEKSRWYLRVDRTTWTRVSLTSSLLMGDKFCPPRMGRCPGWSVVLFQRKLLFGSPLSSSLLQHWLLRHKAFSGIRFLQGHQVNHRVLWAISSLRLYVLL